MFLSLDGTFWIQLLNFGIFFAILNVVFLRPVGKAIKERRAYIESVQSDLAGFQSEIGKLRSEGDQKRAAARRAADETIAKARSDAESTAAGISEEQAAVASALTAEARAVVAAEMAVARTREDQITQTLAQSLLQRALGKARS